MKLLWFITKILTLPYIFLCRSASSRSNVRLSHDKQPEERQIVVHNYDKEKNSRLCGIIPCSPETRDTLREMLDFSLLKDPIFILFTVSNFCTSIGFNIPYVYIVVSISQNIQHNFTNFR